MRRRTPAAALAGALALATGLTVPLSTTPAAAAGCSPVRTAPVYRGDVPSPQSVVGFDLGDREVTTAESDRYLAAVDRASDRVVTGVAARSVQGRALRYAIVGSPENVTDEGLARIRRDIAELRDPATSRTEAAALAARTPAILWVAGQRARQRGERHRLRAADAARPRRPQRLRRRADPRPTRSSSCCPCRTRTAASSTPAATRTAST